MEKIFYNPGDRVIVKHSISNRPIMYVVEKVTGYIIHKGDDKNKDQVDPIFKGIKCRWFDENKQLQEDIFSTKDLMFYEE